MQQSRIDRTAETIAPALCLFRDLIQEEYANNNIDALITIYLATQSPARAIEGYFRNTPQGSLMTDKGRAWMQLGVEEDMFDFINERICKVADNYLKQQTT